MKVSILCADLSSNCLGRSYILARVLERRYDVEIVGPAFDERIWEPLAGEPFRYRAWPMERRGTSLPELRRLADWADGDVIYANKPLAASYGVGLWARLKRPRPLVLDIDDWDAAFVREALRGLTGWRRLRYLLGSTLRPHLNHGLWNNLLFDRLTSYADRRTVSNSFLAQRFGGTLVWHGRDTDAFRPGNWDRAQLRRRHGLREDEPLVAFVGTLHPYKGVDDLVEALAGLGVTAPSLLLVGIGDDPVSRATLEAAKQRLNGRVHCFGRQRFDRVPEFLSLADAAIVPQRESRATLGQMPAKLFDAMALGVPAISTAVSDIPSVLEGAGWVVPPDSPEALRDAIRERFADPAEAARRAAVARQRCVERFSWDAMARDLQDVFERLEPQPR